MGLILTKLENESVEVTGIDQPYTLLPNMHVFKDSSVNGVKVISDGIVKAVFNASNVDSFIRKDGTNVTISSAEILYSELKINGFFTGASPVAAANTFDATFDTTFD